MHLLLPLQDTSQINCVSYMYDVPTISLIVSFMLLQVHVRNPLITVFALHFSSCEIHCFQGLGKVTMMKEAMRSGMLRMAVARDIAADYAAADTVSLGVFDDIDVDNFDTSGAARSSAGSARQPTQHAALSALMVSDDNDGTSPADTARDRNTMFGVPERRRSSVLFTVEAHPHNEDGTAREASVTQLILNHTMV